MRSAKALQHHWTALCAWLRRWAKPSGTGLVQVVLSSPELHIEDRSVGGFRWGLVGPGGCLRGKTLSESNLRVLVNAVAQSCVIPFPKTILVGNGARSELTPLRLFGYPSDMQSSCSWSGHMILAVATLATSSCDRVLGLNEFHFGCPDGTVVDGPDVPCPVGTTGQDGATTSAASTSGAGGPCLAQESRPCYDGASGTEGTGLCKAGTQSCIDGTWGTCVGQVTPSTEICVLGGGDEDCNGVACSEPLWVKTYSNANTTSVEFNDAGDLYIAGFFTGSAWGLMSNGRTEMAFSLASTAQTEI